MSRRAASFANRFPSSANYAPSATLTTPTYTGTGITTEPTWIAKPSWVTATGTDLLAHNPLAADGNSDVENPSLLISNDKGSTWTTPPGLTNPIAPKPTAAGQLGSNADCHLFADPHANRLIMCWLVASDPTVVAGNNQNGIWYSTCTDPTLVTWSARAQLFSPNGISAPMTSSSTELEPKIVWDAVRGKHLFFLIDNPNGSPDVVKVRIGGTNPLSGYGAAQTCRLVIPGGQTPWHMDIIQEPSGRFIMAFCDNATYRQAWLASSQDGINWLCAPRPFMRAVPGGWAQSGGLYRPSIQPARTGSGYDIITARQQTPTAQLGLTRNVPPNEIP